MLQKD